MIIQTTDFKRVQSLLYEDELINSPMIRLLDAPPPDMEIWLDTAPQSNGILCTQSPLPGTRDAMQYPAHWKRVWIESLSTVGVDGLSACLPQEHEFLFKFHRQWIAAHLMSRFTLEWKGTLFYFMLIPCDFVDRRKHNVRQLTAQHMPQAIDLLTDSGRSAVRLDEVLAHADVAAFGAFQDDQLVAGAFIEPRTKRTMEICAVYTHEVHRGQGYAASVVSSATRWILEKGKLPVYATHKTNTASIRLAQHIGYTKYGQVDHYFHSG